jgi:hypothetical protein
MTMLAGGIAKREKLVSSSASDWRINPDADHVYQRQADSFVGRRLKDLSVFDLQGG